MEEQVRKAQQPSPNSAQQPQLTPAPRPQHPGLYEKARDKALVTMEGLTIQHSAAQTFLGSQGFSASEIKQIQRKACKKDAFSVEKLSATGIDKLRADLGQSPGSRLAVSPPVEPQLTQPQPPPPPSISPRGRPRDNIADRPIALAAATPMPTPMSLQPAGDHRDAWRVGDSPSPTPADEAATQMGPVGCFSAADATGNSDAQEPPWCLPEPLDLDGAELPFSPHAAAQGGPPPTLLRTLTDPTLPEAKRPRFIDAAAGAAGTASTDTL